MSTVPFVIVVSVVLEVISVVWSERAIKSFISDLSQLSQLSLLFLWLVLSCSKLRIPAAIRSSLTSSAAIILGGWDADRCSVASVSCTVRCRCDDAMER